MTEMQWLSCIEPDRLLDFIANVAPSEMAVRRKLRLFAVACCRHIGRLLVDPRSWQALEWVEHDVDGLVQEVERLEVARAAGSVTYELADDYIRLKAAEAVYDATDDIQDDFIDTHRAATNAAIARAAEASGGTDVEEVDLYRAAVEAEQDFQCRLVRDIFGNPFRSAVLDCSILNPRVIELAHAAYHERVLPSGELQPYRLQVLSDALEDAGAVDQHLLAHLRDPGPHVRGCWALDLILGKMPGL